MQNNQGQQPGLPGYQAANASGSGDTAQPPPGYAPLAPAPQELNQQSSGKQATDTGVRVASGVSYIPANAMPYQHSAPGQPPYNYPGGAPHSYSTFYQQGPTPMPVAANGTPYGYPPAPAYAPAQGFAPYTAQPYPGYAGQAPGYPPSYSYSGTPVPAGGIPVMGSPVAVQEPYTPCRCSAVWILFGLGFIFPVLWLVGGLGWSCFYARSKDVNDRRAGIACWVMMCIVIIVLSFSISSRLRAEHQEDYYRGL